MLIGSKLDLAEKRETEELEAKEFADKHRMIYYEVSALTGENIDEAFDCLLKSIISNKEFIYKCKYYLLAKNIKNIIAENKPKIKKSKWFG